jgi:hypothetical protein
MNAALFSCLLQRTIALMQRNSHALWRFLRARLAHIRAYDGFMTIGRRVPCSGAVGAPACVSQSRAPRNAA